jgi:rhodanese-related sulfurtransferase
MGYREKNGEKNRDTRAMFVGGVLIVLVGVWFIGRQLWKNHEEAVKETPYETPVSDEKDAAASTITVEAVRQKLINGDKVKFLDIRGEESFQREHIPHSSPLSPGALGSYTGEPNELSVIVFSAKDTRTLEVIKNILKQRSTHLFLLEGGMEEWKKSGNATIVLGDPNSFIDQSKVTYITPAAAQALLSQSEKSVFLLDVQSEQNYQKKHIRGAKNIPLDQLEKRSEEIPPAKKIIVYGDSELLSFQGGVRLSDLGVFTAQTVSGNPLGKDSPLPLEP